MKLTVRARKGINLGIAVTLLISVSGCGSGYVNERLNAPTVLPNMAIHNTGSRTESFLQPLPAEAGDSERMPNSQPPGPDKDGYFVGLAISGGGSRSANFATGCMFELQRIGILQRVDCISCVSGGTLPAALYCLSPDSQWNPATMQEKLTHAYATDLLGDVLIPWNLLALCLGSESRADLLAADFDKFMFARNKRSLTFADLRSDRPRLFINCTDLETGLPFTFDNSNFNLLNSNLSRYPISYAAAASAAVPAILHPVALRDFSTKFEEYYHLVDGGIYDNLGVQTLVESYEARASKQPDPFPHGALLIVIDAGVPVQSRVSDSAVPGLLESFLAGLGLSSAVLVNRASSATLKDLIVMHASGDYTTHDLRAFVDQLENDHYVELRDQSGHQVRVVHLSLGQVGQLSNSQFGATVNTIPTDFNITSEDAYNLYKAAAILFSQRFDEKLIPIAKEMEAVSGPATRPH